MRNRFLTFFAIPLFLAAPFAALPFSCSVTSDGGVYRSLDRGETFEQKVSISKKQSIGRSNILTIKMDPRDSKIIYLGTMSDGIYKTMDSGDTWYKLNAVNPIFDKRANVYDIAIDPKNSANIYVGTYQDRFGRLFRSPDGGKNWEEVYRVSREQYAVFAVEIDSYDTSVVYMGTAEGGLLKSSDYGKSWQVIKWFEDVITDIKVDPHDTRIVYVSTDQKGIYKTIDKGTTWQQLGSALNFWESKQIETLMMDQNQPNVLYTGSKSGLLKSSDGGQNWERVNIVIPPNSVKIEAVALDPLNGSFLYYAAGNVLYRSNDGGLAWTVYPIASSKNIEVITIDPNNTKVVYLGMRE